MANQANQTQLSNPQKYFLCNQCCFWIFQVVVVALALVAMGRTIDGYQIAQEVKNSSQYQHSLQTVWLWQQGYIIDIKAENTNNCPEGYQPLIDYQWPGSIDGCYCTTAQSGYSFDFVLEGYCSSQLISLGCQTINTLAAQTLNMWKSSSLLCYKRAAAMSFYESVMTAAPLGGTSPTMDVCSPNTTYQVNTLPGVPCPISAFSSNTVGASQTTLTLDSTTSTTLNFINQTGYPIAAFKLTQYQFCQFFNDSNISPNKKGTYLLERNYITSPCSSTDPRMVQIDSMDELNLYQNNSRVYQLIQSLPAYPLPSVDYIFKLGYIPYPTWTYPCRNTNQFSLYKTTDKILFKAPEYIMTVALSVTVICVLILVLLFRIFFIIRHIVNLKSRTSYNALMLTDDQIAEQMPNLDIIKSYKRECVIFIIQLLLILGIAISISYALSVLTHESVWIKQIIKQQCTDSHLEKIFLYYQDKIDNISIMLVEASFVWGVLLISLISYFVTRNYIGDLSSTAVEVQSQKQQSVNSNEIMVLEKEGRLEGVNPNGQSSQFVLNKQDKSELKVYDMDFLMDNGGETKFNFYGSVQKEQGIQITKKKKKKKRVINSKKKSTLIPQDQF